jgi:hypothetical protein
VALDLLVSLGEINMLGTCSNLLINFIKISASLRKLSSDVIRLFLSQVSILFLLQEVLENREFLAKNSLLDFNTKKLPVIGIELVEPKSCNNWVSNICEVSKFLLVISNRRVLTFVISPVESVSDSLNVFSTDCRVDEIYMVASISDLLFHGVRVGL